MKALFKLSIVCLFTFAVTSTKTFAQTNEMQGEDNSLCLEFNGSFDGTVLDLTGLYTAQLIQNNKIIKEVTISVNRPFKFLLKRDASYTVKLVKQGYISKVVSISTVLPKKVEIESMYKFNLQTNLISEELAGRFQDDDVDFPIALVSYGKRCNCFEYNRDYTEKLIYNMYNTLVFGN